MGSYSLIVKRTRTKRIIFVLSIAILTGLPGLARAAEDADDRPPNVVMIIADDQAWTDYGFMGHPQIRTPHLDKLAGESLTLTRGYVTSSLCSPSLATILTGLYPHQHKITSNDPPLPPGTTRRTARRDPRYRASRREMIGFFEAVPTLPRLLEDRGYLSFQTGKWWGGNFRTGGFTHGMTQGDPDEGGRHGDAGLTIGRQGMRPITDFLDLATDRDRPFFLWYAPFLPHSPHNPPDRLLDHYRDQAPTIEVARYWAMCEWLDETCGELLGMLDDRGLAEDTIVVFLADNGWIQDPDADRYAPRSKQSQYDGGLRTPILIRWPGHVEPQRSDQLASSIDLAPTVLAATGLEPTQEMRGINLLDEAATQAREAIFGECFTHNAVDIHHPASSLRWRWAIEGDWKLILPDARNEPAAEVELYNLTEDPFESRNLATERPEKVEHLKRLINDWWPAEGP